MRRATGVAPVRDSAYTKLVRSIKSTVELPGDFIVPEVYTGETGPSDWPEGSSKRMIDGFRFRSEYRDGITVQAAFSQSQLRDIVKDRHVEVIEDKTASTVQ
jgi:hypothetical protein